jgi:hypothetical protein
MTTSASPSKSPNAEVQRYLRTGDHDSSYRCWPGGNLFESARIGDAALRSALIERVLACDASAAMPPAICAIDVNALTRARVAPMVEGLFPKTEQGAVLAMLERSVVFLTPANIEAVLRSTPWLDTAWSLANLYVASIGAEKLSQEARAIVGLSEETTCYVSVDYFREQDPWADFLVHEAAHVFHNCKRATVGLAETRRREWLLDIDYGMRETFAYACEAYSRILTLGDRLVRRRASLGMHAQRPQPGHPSVHAEEYLDQWKESCPTRHPGRVGV